MDESHPNSVVVHVVWNKPEQNIGQEQIDSQIRVLNEDSNATNSDLSNLPATLKPLVGNPHITFFPSETRSGRQANDGGDTYSDGNYLV
jgi:hypothetical protein